MPHLGRWKLYLIASALIIAIVTVSLAYYALSAPSINHLPVVSKTQALSSIPYYYNTSYTFSSGTTEWLVALQTSIVVTGENYATLYLFKIRGDAGKNVAILGFDPRSNVTGGYFQVNHWSAFPESNNTIITVGYHLGMATTYSLEFGLLVQVYTAVLYLPMAQEKIRVPVNLVVHYG